MTKIYWEFNYYSFIFKFYICEVIIVLAVNANYKIKGNKRSCKEVSIPGTLLSNKIVVCNILEKKPELELWNKYLSSFWISKKILLELLDNLIDGPNGYWLKQLKKIKNKIKDKPL